MQRLATTMIAVMALLQFASAGEMVSYIAMPVGVGHATDAIGRRYSNAIAMKDVVRADRPQYPYSAELGCTEPRHI